MKEFKSLNPAGLSDSFNTEMYGDEPLVEVNESEGCVIIAYTFPGFYLSDDGKGIEGEWLSFKQVNLKSVGFLSESGKPLLPSFGRYVQIPFNCDFEVNVNQSDPVYFDDVLILPAQEQLTDNPAQEHHFEYDREFYTRDRLYPDKLVDVTGPFEIDGYNSLLVEVRPFQYNSAKRQLMGYSNLTVTINLTPALTSTADYPLVNPQLNREAYGNFFLNPKRNIEARLASQSPRIITPSREGGAEFLIIYHETFKKAAETLANWKNRRGLLTETKSIAEIGHGVETLKQYIRNRRKSVLSRLRYVLLLGDVEMIPSETIQGGLWGDNVTDYYYSTPKDPAHPHDLIMPWLAIGRIPVQTESESMAVVEQAIAYEKHPPGDSEYYRRMTFAAYFQDNFPKDGKADRAYMKTMESVREHLITLGFDVERVYVSSNPNPQEYRDGTPVPSDVKNAIVNGATATNMLIRAVAEGQLLIGHRDHGTEDGWHEPSFEKSHLSTITSNSPTIFYSINCLTGQFDLANSTQSFAEMILRMKGGAPSLIAATRVSGTWRNDSLLKALFDAMWPGILPSFPDTTASYGMKGHRLGDILNYAKFYLPTKHGGDASGVKDHFEIYHVIGDPTLELWDAEPAIIGIRAFYYQSSLFIFLSACPQDGTITIWHDDKLLKRIEPSSRVIKVPLKDIDINRLSPVERRISVCFKAPGYRFRQINVRI